MRKGFTLIELLIVIAILAVLATAVTLILNPAELLRQGRDATRLSDLAAIHSALALYLADVQSFTWTSTIKCTYDGSDTITLGSCSGNVNASTTVDSTGWVNVDFEDISGGSPLSRLPIDPVNDASNFYVFARATSTYEINAAMESERYTNGGGSDVESTDGGSSGIWYEIGNDPGLDL